MSIPTLIRVVSHRAREANTAEGYTRRATRDGLADGDAPFPGGNIWEGVVELEAEGEARLDEVFRLFSRVDLDHIDRLKALDYGLPSISVGDHVALAHGQHPRWDGEWLRELTGWRRADSGP
jgi:hypothetical protein